MNSVMALFLNCIAALHTTLTGTVFTLFFSISSMSICYLMSVSVLSGGTIVLAYIWQYYYDHLVNNNVPEYVLVVYHTNLVKLPWKCFVPDQSVLDQMAKVCFCKYSFFFFFDPVLCRCRNVSSLLLSYVFI